MKAATSRQGDSVVTRGPDDLPGIALARVRPMAEPDRGDPCLIDVWRPVVIVAAGWLVLLAIALLVLSTASQQPPPPIPEATVRSGFHGIDPQPLGAEISQ